MTKTITTSTKVLTQEEWNSTNLRQTQPDSSTNHKETNKQPAPHSHELRNQTEVEQNRLTRADPRRGNEDTSQQYKNSVTNNNRFKVLNREKQRKYAAGWLTRNNSDEL